MQSRDGQLFRINSKVYSHNIHLIENGRPVVEYCIVCREFVPRCDQVLAQKLLIESNLDEFLRIANYRNVVELGNIAEVDPDVVVNINLQEALARVRTFAV